MILATVLLMLLLGILVKYFRCYWLIAATTPCPVKKEKVDTAGLGNFLGNGMFILAVLMLVAGLLHRAGFPYAGLVAGAVLFVVVPFLLVKAQRYDHNPKTKRDRLVLGLVLGSFVLIGPAVAALIVFSSLPPPINIAGGYLEIGGSYGIDQPIAEIEEISLRDGMPVILGKINGFDAGPVKKGVFRLEELGTGRLYLQSPVGPFIHLDISDGYIIINCKKRQQTEQLYRNLITALKE